MCRDAVDFACRNAGFAPDVVSGTNDYMAAQGPVAAGVGVALRRAVASVCDPDPPPEDFEPQRAVVAG